MAELVTLGGGQSGISVLVNTSSFVYFLVVNGTRWLGGGRVAMQCGGKFYASQGSNMPNPNPNPPGCNAIQNTQNPGPWFMRNDSILTEAGCCSACTANPMCKGWNLNWGTAGSESRGCFLQNFSSSKSVPLTGVTSGTSNKGSLQPNMFEPLPMTFVDGFGPTSTAGADPHLGDYTGISATWAVGNCTQLTTEIRSVG